MAFVTETVPFLLKHFLPSEIHDTVFSFGFLQLLWLLFLSLLLCHSLNIPQQFFQDPFSPHPIFQCALPNLTAFIAIYILTTPKSLSLTIFSPKPFTLVSICLVGTSSSLSHRPLRFHMSKKVYIGLLRSLAILLIYSCVLFRRIVAR